jgi:hypothetical protein
MSRAALQPFRVENVYLAPVLDSILIAESSGTSLNQGYGLGAHHRSATDARLSVRSDLHMNLEYFHRTSISINGFRALT